MSKKKKVEPGTEVTVYQPIADREIGKRTFSDADTAFLLHIAEIWNLRPKEIFACRIESHTSAPSNSIVRVIENGWCGSGLYAIAPVWDWISAFREVLVMPGESTYARVLSDDRRNSSLGHQVH